MLGRRQNDPFVRSPRTSARAISRRKTEPQARTTPAGRSKRATLWYALYFPTLSNGEVSVIPVVAQHCQQVSDYISLDGDNALVLEVGRSLRYFGSLARIRQRIEAGVSAQLAHTDFLQAVAPSASASLLLARSGHEAAIGNSQDLRSRLGSIPTSALAIDIRVRKKLAKCGLFYLRDIWRLPLPELRIRFGRHFSDHIEHCLGLRPEMRKRWQADPVYHDHYDADHGLYSVQQILSACEQLLQRLEIFLKKNHLCTAQLVFHMDYTTGGEPDHQQEVSVNLRNADRHAQLFFLLLETQLSGMTFAGEIYGITLHVKHFTQFTPSGGIEHKTPPPGKASGSHLLDTLAARLGSDSVQRLFLQQDYCPEFATRMVPYLMPLTKDSGYDAITGAQNPCWLLHPPRPLTIRNQQLHYLSPLTLLRGPRRIETRWWQDNGIRRDYYVAANTQGNLLWIFQDLVRNTQAAQRQTDWYLHGFFG